jgi:cell division protein ZapA (FtsZ GTPase activity inhibitor)
MKESDPVNSYSISINKKKYVFTCPDGEDHVRDIESKLTAIISAVAGHEPGHVLSDYAVKVALLLADEAISEEKCRASQSRDIEEKVEPMLRELDRVLSPDKQL